MTNQNILATKLNQAKDKDYEQGEAKIRRSLIHWLLETPKCYQQDQVTNALSAYKYYYI